VTDQVAKGYSTDAGRRDDRPLHTRIQAEMSGDRNKLLLGITVPELGAGVSELGHI
jgi:hypothetical protein